MDLVKDRDLLSGIGLAALGVFILTQALQWNYIGPDGPGPGFFPLWYGLLMIVLSLCLVLKAAFRPDAESRANIDWRGIGRAVAVWAAFAASVALMEPLGFAASFGLLAFTVIALVMGKPLLVAISTSALMVAGFWLLFPVALGLNLPVGTVWTPLARAVGIG